MKVKKKNNINRKFIEFIHNRTWHDYLFIMIILLYLIVQINAIGSLKQLPSPLYGGDYYHQLGAVNHVKYGGNPLLSTDIKESYTFNLPFYSGLLGYSARMFNVDSITITYIYSNIFLIISLILTYLLLNYFFKDKLISLIGLIILIPLTSYPIFKYTNLAFYFFAPLIILFTFYYQKNNNLLNSVLFGIFLGFAGLTHPVIAIFLFTSLMAYFIILIFVLPLYREFSLKKIRTILKDDKKRIVNILICMAIATSISMLFWYGPLFKFNGDLKNPYNEFTSPNLFDFNISKDITLASIKSVFFNFSTLNNALITLLFYIGIFTLVLMKRIEKYEELKIYLITFGILFLGVVYHYILTVIIFKTFITLNYTTIFFKVIFGLIALFGLISLKDILHIGKYYQYFLVILLIALISLNYTQFTKNIDENKWWQAGRTDINPIMQEVSNYIIENTDVNDVFISSNEPSFALNALTGRKVFTNRRGHVSTFFDLDTRYVEAAIVLYGDNDALREEIIRKYDIRYLYWDYYWKDSEYTLDSNGNIVSWYDPLSIWDTKEKESILKENNINYFKQYTWIDPASRNNDIKKDNLLFILPSSFNDNPWNQKLDKYLEEEYVFSYQNQIYAKIYKINIGEE